MLGVHSRGRGHQVERSEQRGTWHGGLVRTLSAEQSGYLHPARREEKLREGSWVGQTFPTMGPTYAMTTWETEAKEVGLPTQGRSGTQVVAQPSSGPWMGSLTLVPARTVPVGVVSRGGAVPIGDLPGRAAHRGRSGPGRRRRALC